jgi:hypothetical protein
MSHPAAEHASAFTTVRAALVTHRRRLILLAAFAAATLLLLIVLGGGRATLSTVAGADLRWLGLALLVHYSGFAVRGHRWQRLLALMGHRLPYTWVTGLLFSGWFISALLPARAGDLARIGLLRSTLAERKGIAPVPVADGLGSIVLERALDIFAILLLGAGFGFVALRNLLPPWILWTYAAAVGILVLLGVALLVAPPLLVRLRRATNRALWQKAVDFTEQLVASLRALGRSPRSAFVVMGESLYIWLCDAVLLWLVMRSLGEGVSFGRAAFVALSVDALAAVPITPGGIGQIETAYAALLSLFSLPLASASAAILLTRAISFWSFLVVSGGVMVAFGVDQMLPQLTSSRSDARSGDPLPTTTATELELPR